MDARPSRHFNELTPAEAERLAILLEEMGEAQQVVGKILRHGYDSQNPRDGANGRPNRFLLEEELGDVLWSIRALMKAKDTSMEVIEHRCAQKDKRIIPYLHHQPRGEAR